MRSNLLLLVMLAFNKGYAKPLDSDPLNMRITPDYGKMRFIQYCASCHGITGEGRGTCPNNQGSSLELITLKVREGKYPLGYKPKKLTKMMPKFKQLDDGDLTAIFEYLQLQKRD